MQQVKQAIPKELDYAEKLVRLMDDQFKIPFINFRFGLDPIIGLIPWAGDVVTFLISAFIITALVREGLPRKLVVKMTLNIILDLLIGGIPVIGDVWDFFNKANRKNLRLAKDYFQSGK